MMQMSQRARTIHHMSKASWRRALQGKYWHHGARHYLLPAKVLGNRVRALLDVLRLVLILFLLILEKPKGSFLVHVCSADRHGNGVNGDVLGELDSSELLDLTIMIT